MSNVLIAGGSGLLGQALTSILSEAGHQVSILSRQKRAKSLVPVFLWNVEKGQIDDGAIAAADVIINLAGEGIADARWTDERKTRIIESRTQSAALIKASLIRSGTATQKTYISASAQGFYGDCGQAWVTEENTASGIGFLSQSCIAWEAAANSVAETGVRLVVFRIGIVLSTHGGALQKMLVPYQFGLATYFGDGQQYYSWIHIQDICNMIKFAIDNTKIQGTFNASAPKPLTNRQFAMDIATARGSFALALPAPVFALRLALGELADTVLTSTRMNVDSIMQKGFVFEYPTLIPALKHLLQNKK